MTLRLDTKAPSEKVLLTFDFSVGLDEGETLIGTPEVTTSVLIGRDTAPGEIFNGAASIDGTARWVYVPVRDGVDGCDYFIKVTCRTNSDTKVLALTAILPVRTLA